MVRHGTAEVLPSDEREQMALTGLEEPGFVSWRDGAGLEEHTTLLT
jgi:hypothetical protein